MAYNPRKAAQTIAYFILKSGLQDMNSLKAVKLIYLADRECIRKRGFPIQDEDRVSMKHGPVNSSTYDHIKGEVDLDQCGWADFLNDKANHRIGLSNNTIKEDDLDEMSENEMEVLESVWGQFGHMNQWELVDYTHDPEKVPEWENMGNSSKPIPLLSIMRAVGLPNAKEHAEEVEAFSRMDDTWNRLRNRANSPSAGS